MIEVREVSCDKRGTKDFIDFQYDLYGDDPYWVAPIRFERNTFFNKKKNPYFEHAEAAYFVAYENGKAVGTVTAQVDHRFNEHNNVKQGFFGFFESVNRVEVARALLEKAEAWLRERKMDSMMGPNNFSINHECGFLYEGFDKRPVVMMPYTKEYYIDLLESAGFRTEKILNSYSLTDVNKIPDLVTRASARLMKKFGDDIEIRTIDMKNMKKDVDIIYDIYNEAWSDNWGYVPMTRAEMDELAANFKLIADPRIMYLLYKGGEPAACLVAIPDLNQILYENPTGGLTKTVFNFLFRKKKMINRIRVVIMGVKHKFRNLGLDFLLYNQIFGDGLELTHYKNVDMSWILEDNEAMNSHIQKVGGEIYKKHVIFGKEL